MRSKPEPKTSATSGAIPWRAVFISLVLMPFNAYWIVHMEGVLYLAHATLFSLFFNVVFILFVLVGVNVLLKGLAPRHALRQVELITIYIMLSQATALVGHSYIQLLPQTLAAPRAWATPENDWQNLFGHLIPSWASASDEQVLRDFSGSAKGVSTLFEARTFQAWLLPLVAWSAFISVLLFVMVCMNTILRKQWTDHEKLTYPIVQLPYEMTDDAGHLLRSPSMWISFAVVALVDLVNGLDVFLPAVPSLRAPVFDLGTVFTRSPWNAMGAMFVTFRPFLLGVIFLMPLEISLSCWVFFFFWKAQLVLGKLMGWQERPEFPEQSAGAYIGLCLIALWMGRHHFWRALQSSWDQAKDDGRAGAEPLSYRTAVLGILVGLVLLLGFCWKLGMSPWVAGAFIALYLMIETGVTRVRAEVGSPVHDLHFAGPEVLAVGAVGARAVGPRSLAAMSLLWFLTRAHYADPMPHQLEGFRMADRAHVRQRSVLIPLLIASVVGAVVAFLVVLDVGYRSRNVVMAWAGTAPFVRLQGWLTQPQAPDPAGIAFLAFGVLMSVSLMFMRTRFLWWPLHPAGYAVSSTYALRKWWFIFLLAWAIKSVVLKHGGVRGLRRVTPFFFGMILGEFVVGSLWALLGVLIHVRTFGFTAWW